MRRAFHHGPINQVWERTGRSGEAREANIHTSRVKVYTWVDATALRRTGLAQAHVMPVHEVIFISVAARRLGMHPQTLRKYERLGLVRPPRTAGSMRVYSEEELYRLRVIRDLVEEHGINLAGVQHLLAIADVVRRLQALTRDGRLTRPAGRRRLTKEVDRLRGMLGI